MIENLISLIVLLIIVWSMFIISDIVLVKIFKTKENTAALISFFLILIWIMSGYLKLDSLNMLDSEYKLAVIILFVFDVFWLFISLYFIKKDNERREELRKYPYETLINVDDLSLLSNISKSRIKYYCHLKLLLYQIDDKNKILLLKGSSIERLSKIKELLKKKYKINDIIDQFNE
jgi:hypothetical protein